MACDPSPLRGRRVLRRAVTHPAALLAASILLAPGALACGAPVEGDPGLTFGDLRAEEIGPRRAVIRFVSDRPVRCVIAYGQAPTALEQSATDQAMAAGPLDTVHEVALEDLSPETPYFFRAEATDAEGRSYRSEILSFTTLAETAAPGGRDVALLTEGAQVLQVSSNFGGAANDETWGAEAALDGQMATEWASAGDGEAAFLELDLGRSRVLVAVGLRSRAFAMPAAHTGVPSRVSCAGSRPARAAPGCSGGRCSRGAPGRSA